MALLPKHLKLPKVKSPALPKPKVPKMPKVNKIRGIFKY